MRRLALKSSSAKKRSNSDSNSILFKPEKQVSQSQLREIQKANKIYKTNLSSSKRTNSYSNKTRKSVRRVIEEDVEMPNPEDLEMAEEEQDILDATSRNTRSISADPTTPIETEMNGNSIGGHPYYYSKSQLNQYQDTSLLQFGSDHRGSRTPTSPGPNQRTINHINKSSNKNQSPNRHRTSVDDSSKINHTSHLHVSQEAMQTIRRKMGDLARELAQSDEIGLDEATLIRFFETRTQDLLQSQGIQRPSDIYANDGSNSKLGKHAKTSSNHQSSKSIISKNESASKKKSAPLSRQNGTQAAFMNQASEIFQVQPHTTKQNHFHKGSQETHNTSVSPNRLRPSARFMQKSGENNSAYRESSLKRSGRGSQSSTKNLHIIPSNLSRDFRDTFAQRELNQLAYKSYDVGAKQMMIGGDRSDSKSAAKRKVTKAEQDRSNSRLSNSSKSKTTDVKLMRQASSRSSQLRQNNSSNNNRQQRQISKDKGLMSNYQNSSSVQRSRASGQREIGSRRTSNSAMEEVQRSLNSRSACRLASDNSRRSGNSRSNKSVSVASGRMMRQRNLRIGVAATPPITRPIGQSRHSCVPPSSQLQQVPLLYPGRVAYPVSTTPSKAPHSPLRPLSTQP